jgi:hypothetical protein
VLARLQTHKTLSLLAAVAAAGADSVQVPAPCLMQGNMQHTTQQQHWSHTMTL